MRKEEGVKEKRWPKGGTWGGKGINVGHLVSLYEILEHLIIKRIYILKYYFVRIPLVIL